MKCPNCGEGFLEPESRIVARTLRESEAMLGKMAELMESRSPDPLQVDPEEHARLLRASIERSESWLQRMREAKAMPEGPERDDLISVLCDEQSLGREMRMQAQSWRMHGPAYHRFAISLERFAARVDKLLKDRTI